MAGDCIVMKSVHNGIDQCLPYQSERMEAVDFFFKLDKQIPGPFQVSSNLKRMSVVFIVINESLMDKTHSEAPNLVHQKFTY